MSIMIKWLTAVYGDDDIGKIKYVYMFSVVLINLQFEIILYVFRKQLKCFINEFMH